MRRAGVVFGAGLVVVAVGVGFAQVQEKKTVAPPDIAGDWTGTWGVVLPPGSKMKLPDMRLDCNVVQKGKKWDATFEGEAGRPYKYKIKMEGRQVGGAALFKGTVDLGPKDGGVFDWIGRANNTEFVGFFTSEKYAGNFRLARKGETQPVPAPAPKETGGK